MSDDMFLCLTELAPGKCCATGAMISISLETIDNDLAKFKLDKPRMFVAVYDAEPSAMFAGFDNANDAMRWICAAGFVCVTTRDGYTFTDVERGLRSAVIVKNWRLDHALSYASLRGSVKRHRNLNTVALRPIFLEIMSGDMPIEDKYLYMEQLFRVARRCKGDRHVYAALKLALDVARDDFDDWSEAEHAALYESQW